MVMVGVSHCKSAPCSVWCPWTFLKWRYNLFNLSGESIWQPHWRIMQIYGKKLLLVCCHQDKFFDHRHCDRGDIMFLICHVTSRKHMFKDLYWFMGGSSTQWVTTLPYLVTIGPVQVGINGIQNVAWPQKTTWLKDHVTVELIVEALHGMPPSCQVW